MAYFANRGDEVANAETREADEQRAENAQAGAVVGVSIENKPRVGRVDIPPGGTQNPTGAVLDQRALLAQLEALLRQA
eukprot:5742378-Amphidinium_carterae.1